jgi:UDPglucose--hexose-1-phosphate uridylyltransferase
VGPQVDIDVGKSSELRKDPIAGRWVIIATERVKRPNDFQQRTTPQRSSGLCPFCLGNEDKTPPEILAHRPNGGPPNTPGWTIRVVPNKFPALRIEGHRDRRPVGLYDMMTGIGAHEVLIESPDHSLQLEQLSAEQIARVIAVYLERSRDLKRDSRFKYVLIFKNKGWEAGASLEHTHTQIIATPILPAITRQELKRARQYYEFHERCIFCDIVTQELGDGERVVSSTDRFVALSPFAPRFPFETWILPRKHQSAFDELSPDESDALAAMLKDVLLRLRVVLNDPPYNFVVHTAPLHDPHLEHYHWHVEIMPKLTRVAGFEWGTGFYINPMDPEGAAKYLRDAKVPTGSDARP